MASVITQRIGGAVAGTPVNTGAGGIVQTTDVAGTNTITASGRPRISAYFAGQIFLVRPFAANTGAVTLNIDDVGALAWNKPSGAAHGNADLSPNIAYFVQVQDDLGSFRTIAPLG